MDYSMRALAFLDISKWTWLNLLNVFSSQRAMFSTEQYVLNAFDFATFGFVGLNRG